MCTVTAKRNKSICCVGLIGAAHNFCHFAKPLTLEFLPVNWTHAIIVPNKVTPQNILILAAYRQSAQYRVATQQFCFITNSLYIYLLNMIKQAFLLLIDTERIFAKLQGKHLPVMYNTP